MGVVSPATRRTASPWIASPWIAPPIPAAGSTTQVVTPGSVANPLGLTKTTTYDGINRDPTYSYGTVNQMQNKQARPSMNAVGLDQAGKMQAFSGQQQPSRSSKG